jgi:magnesium transporter
MEDFGEYLFIVLRMIDLDESGLEIRSEQVSLVLGPTWVLTFQEAGKDVFDPVRERLRAGRGRARRMGADYLAYALIDAVVDNYFTVLEAMGERVETIEERVVSNVSTATLREIHALKRELINLRKSVWPLREVVSVLLRGETPLFTDATRVFLRDVYDHTVQVIDGVETYRDMVSSMLDIYLSSQSNRLNEIMKVLTIMSSIFIPLTFIAGVYGMNFEFMPELKKEWAYPAVLGVMAAVGLSLVVFFRRKKWL